MQPALERLAIRLRESGDQWGSVLEQWYREQWEAALRQGSSPDSASVFEILPGERVPEARTLLSRLDQSYRALRDSHSHNGAEATLPLRQDDTARPPSGVGSNPGLELTADMMSTPPDSVGSVGSGFEVTTDFGGRSKTVVRRGKSPRPLPAQIGSYRIESELGRGGMGVVYLARQEGIDRPVALKMILDADLAGPERLSRFQTEAQAIGRFQHENIVRVYEFGEHDGAPYFSLEYIDGPSLAERCRDEVVAPQDAARLMAHVARGVEYAHQRGVVHRDLKPANVLLTRDGVPKITDFGLAKRLDADSELSRDGAVLGTPSYMAPEQARGAREVGRAADVYGLGAMLYSVLTGRAPFVGASATDTVLEVIHRDPVGPRQLQPTIPLDLETICLKCLHKEPERRYPSAAAVADDLDHFLAGEPISARPVSRGERVWRWCQRNPRVAIPSLAAGLLALTLMIGGPLAAGLIFQQKQAIGQARDRAEENAKRAHQMQVKAEANAVTAREAEAEATAQKVLAEKNSDAAQTQQKLAVDTLKMLVFEVQRQLQDRPRLQDLRRQLLQTARDGLELMEKEGGPPVARNMIAAATYRRLGDLNLDTGRTEAALRDYQHCLSIMESLHEQGQLPNREHNLSTIHDLLATALKEAGNFSEAERHLQKTLEIRQAWLAEKPDFFIEQNVAATLGDLGSVCLRAGKVDEARQWYQRAAELRKKFVDAKPNSLDAHLEWIGARWSLAKIAFQSRQWEESLQGFQSISASLKRLAEQTDSQSVAWNVALSEMDLGLFHLYRDQLPEADQHYADAVQRLESLSAEDPENIRLKENLADALYGLGVVRKRSGQSDPAGEQFQRALVIRREAAEIDPESLIRGAKLALTLARTGDAATAVWQAEKLLPRASGNSRTLYDLAGVFAQASEGQSAETVTAYLTQSRKLLDQAIAAGYARQMDLELDPDLEPLRSNSANPQ